MANTAKMTHAEYFDFIRKASDEEFHTDIAPTDKRNNGTFMMEHWTQAQGQMYVTERAWCDLVSYWPTLPMVTVRIHRHMEFQAKLDRALKTFLAELTDLCELVKKRGAKFPQPPGVMDHSHDWVTQEDVDAILAAAERRRA